MARPTVLMVAEKPSIALSIASALSRGQMSTRKGSTDVHEFDGTFQGFRAHFKVTSVIGHVFSLDFPQTHQNWALTNPLDLFDTQTIKTESNPKVYATEICRVWLDQIAYCHVNTKFSHAVCGQFVDKRPSGIVECSFCHCDCDAEVIRTFHLKITLADESAKVFAWCTGQTAAELLQISPDEFYELPEEEQVMYPSALEHERFMVAVVNCKRQSDGIGYGFPPENDDVSWEITRASKCEQHFVARKKMF